MPILGFTKFKIVKKNRENLSIYLANAIYIKNARIKL
tara:strand:- start:746 stop:856 length:111 start_codon:yes stop_codon:yes gene_type:complete